MLKNKVSKYAMIGVINTFIHLIAYSFFISLSLAQASSNLFAFTIAASFSFAVNAKVTFQSAINLPNYCLYLGSMGAISFFIGKLGDSLMLPSWLSFITFSFVSLVLGFTLSHKIIFRQKRFSGINIR